MLNDRFPILSTSAAVIAVAALLSACASSTDLSESKAAPVETRSTAAGAASAPGATAGAAPQSRVATVDLAAQNAAMQRAAADAAAQRVVYFDFDSFVIKDEFKPAIDSNAKLLAGNRSKRMTVEGHTDERGGHEYNLALGQKRAEAVAKSLELLGVSQQQVEAVSFGEERPADAGHDESAWSKNRRAELKDR